MLMVNGIICIFIVESTYSTRTTVTKYDNQVFTALVNSISNSQLHFHSKFNSRRLVNKAARINSAPFSPPNLMRSSHITTIYGISYHHDEHNSLREREREIERERYVCCCHYRQHCTYICLVTIHHLSFITSFFPSLCATVTHTTLASIQYCRCARFIWIFIFLTTPHSIWSSPFYI